MKKILLGTSALFATGAVFAQANEGSPGAMTSFENKIAKSPDHGGAPGGFIKQPTFGAETGDGTGSGIPVKGMVMEPEGLRRGATAVDTDLNGKMSIDDTTVPLATTAKLATRAAEMLAT